MNYILNKHQEITKSLNILKGIMIGIKADRQINEQEVRALNQWIIDCESIKSNPFGKSLYLYILEAVSDEVITSEEYAEIMYQINSYTKENPYYSYVNRSLQYLEGILRGISFDGIISQKEIVALDKWLEKNKHLQGIFPYDEIYQMVTKTLQDGIIDNEESKIIIDFISALYADVIESDNSNLAELLLEQNIYHIDPELSFDQKQFVISGISQKYKRKEIIDRISIKGGMVKKNVSSLTNYLIICADKNQHWAFSSFGNKIREVLSLRKQGQNIIIVHEFDLYDHFVE